MFFKQSTHSILCVCGFLNWATVQGAETAINNKKRESNLITLT